MFTRVLFVGLASLSIWLSAALYLFGFFEIKDAVEDLAHMLGEEGYIFYLDTRLLGLAVLFLLPASYFVSKITHASFGKLIASLVALFGITMILTPELLVLIG